MMLIAASRIQAKVGRRDEIEASHLAVDSGSGDRAGGIRRRPGTTGACRAAPAHQTDGRGDCQQQRPAQRGIRRRRGNYRRCQLLSILFCLFLAIILFSKSYYRIFAFNKYLLLQLMHNIYYKYN